MHQLERLLARKEQNLTDLQQTLAYSKELEKMYENYNHLLTDLARQISDYESLYTKVKTQYLSKKLKHLKKEMLEQEPAFIRLIENIHIIFRT